MRKNFKIRVVALIAIFVVLGGGVLISSPNASAAEQSVLIHADFVVDSIILTQAMDAEKTNKAKMMVMRPMTGFGGPAPVSEGGFFGPAPVSDEGGSFYGPAPVNGGFVPPTTAKTQTKEILEESGENNIALYGPAPVDVSQVAQDNRAS